MDIATVAATAGGTWELYKDANGNPVVAKEIQAAGRTPQEHAMVIAEVRQLMQAAIDGRLVPVTEIKDIRRKPSLFELRWEIGDQYVSRRLWRLYFVWWRNLGPLRRGLRFAEKPKGLRGKIQQNKDIDLAWTRYKSWRNPSGIR